MPGGIFKWARRIPVQLQIVYCSAWFILCASVAVGIAIFVAPPPSHAQLFKGGRLLRPPVELGIETIAGEPYGVGRWTLQLPPGTNTSLLGGNNFTLTEKNGRAVFQAFQVEPLRAIAREFLGRPQTATVYFLFTGTQPLELQLYAPMPVSANTTPATDPVGHARLLTDWWVKYARQANRIGRPADYPDLLDNYLLATLSRRLNLPPAGQLPPPLVRSITDGLLRSLTSPLSKPTELESSDVQLDHQIGLLFGADDLRSDMQTEVLARRSEPSETASEPLPAPLPYTPNSPEVPANVIVEPIAMHVPAECFYVRFGTFSNYIWCRKTMTRWHDDLQNLLNRRGLDYRLTARMERQISLKESALSELLGPTVVADVAMVGDDLFFREGAAMGMLFQARNNFALSADFNRQRSETLERESDCTEQKVDIAGHQVSLLSTPDNRVRSFYAIDGDFHFVTNSRQLVKRFFEAGAGKNDLGQTAEFRYARSLMPATQDYTVFAYLSGIYFQNVTGPHYQTEMLRRLRSTAEIDMALVAEAAAGATGSDKKPLSELIKAEYLPEGFGQRSDDSRLEITNSGEFVDSLRGGRGTFLPIPDVEFDRITPSEAQRYQQFANWLQTKVSQIDPVVAGIRREPSKLKEPGVERIVLDVQLTPLAAKNYEAIATALGPIAKQRLAQIPGDLISAEAIMSGNLLASKGLGQPQGVYRLFGAMRDQVPEGIGAAAAAASNVAPSDPNAPETQDAPQIIVNGQPIGRGQILNSPLLSGLLGGAAAGQGTGLSPFGLLPPFYFGAYPTPAIFAMLGLREDAPLDQAGYAQMPNGLWQRRDGKFTTASPQRVVLETVTPQFQFVDARRPAQVSGACRRLGSFEIDRLDQWFVLPFGEKCRGR